MADSKPVGHAYSPSAMFTVALLSINQSFFHSINPPNKQREFTDFDGRSDMRLTGR